MTHVRDESKVIYQSKDNAIPSILDPEGASREFRKNWARLIQKIYEVDPLTCPKCQNQMKIISVIENEEVIKKILKHLGLWDVKTRPPPKGKESTGLVESVLDCSQSQLPPSDDYLYYDEAYPAKDSDVSGEAALA